MKTPKFANEYQRESWEKSQKLAAEVMPFCAGVEVLDDNQRSYHVIITDEHGRKWHINRDYHGNVYLNPEPYKHFRMVSNVARHDLSKRICTSQNMKVITKAKLATKIQEQAELLDLCGQKNGENEDKRTAFLASLKGMDITWHYEDSEKTRIDGGDIVQNGIEYSFSIAQDGYIHQKIQLHYSIPSHTLDTFKKLSANKLK